MLKQLLDTCFRRPGHDFAFIYSRDKPQQISDNGPPSKRLIDSAIASPIPAQVAQFKAGKRTVAAFFVGQVMRAQQGPGQPRRPERPRRLKTRCPRRLTSYKTQALCLRPQLRPVLLKGHVFRRAVTLLLEARLYPLRSAILSDYTGCSAAPRTFPRPAPQSRTFPGLRVRCGAQIQPRPSNRRTMRPGLLAMSGCALSPKKPAPPKPSLAPSAIITEFVDRTASYPAATPPNTILLSADDARPLRAARLHRSDASPKSSKQRPARSRRCPPHPSASYRSTFAPASSARTGRRPRPLPRLVDAMRSTPPSASSDTRPARDEKLDRMASAGGAPLRRPNRLGTQPQIGPDLSWTSAPYSLDKGEPLSTLDQALQPLTTAFTTDGIREHAWEHGVVPRRQSPNALASSRTCRVATAG